MRGLSALMATLTMICNNVLEGAGFRMCARSMGRLWSIQGLPSTVPHGMVETLRSIYFSFILCARIGTGWMCSNSNSKYHGSDKQTQADAVLLAKSLTAPFAIKYNASTLVTIWAN